MTQVDTIGHALIIENCPGVWTILSIALAFLAAGIILGYILASHSHRSLYSK